MDWTSIATDGALAYGTQTRNTYDDSYAFLQGLGFAANHQVQCLIHKVGGYNPGVSHEVEILLRCSDSSHSISYYECNLAHDGSYAEIVRLVGGLGNFTSLSLSISSPVAPKEGDVFMAQIVGSTIESYLNGHLLARATDAAITSGQPGMAFFGRPGYTAKSYCFTTFSAKSL